MAAEGDVTPLYSPAQISRVRSLLAGLFSARRSFRLYPITHPANVEARQRLVDVVRPFHAEGVDVVLSFLDGEVRLGEELLAEESVLFDQLIRDFEAMGAGSVAIRRGVTDDEIGALVAVLAADAREIDAAGGISELLASTGARHVEITAVRQIAEETPPDEETARASYDEALSLLREVDGLMRDGRPPSTARVKGAVRSLIDNVLTNQAAMLRLAGLKDYDEYTYYHSANVAILSLALGSAVTTDARFLSALGVGALLHDIGKLAIDLEVLNKRGAFDDAEWQLMRRHPVVGAQTVAALPGMDTSALVMILEHHLRNDGSGYPVRSPERRPHLASRIVAVADSYDAMTSKRPYSTARPQDEAMAALAKEAGTTLDRGLVRLFIRVLGVYPPRSVVKLSDGRIGIVLRPGSEDPLRPLVRLMAAADGTLVAPEDLDLSSTAGTKITGCLDLERLNIDVEDYLLGVS